MNTDERMDEQERRILHLEQLLGGIKIAAGILGITSIGLIGYVVFITTTAGDVSEEKTEAVDEIEKLKLEAISEINNEASVRGYLGSENVIMGMIGQDATRLQGTGFTSRRQLDKDGKGMVGRYVITFDKPFQGRPIVLLSAGNLFDEGASTWGRHDKAFDNHPGFQFLDEKHFVIVTSDVGSNKQPEDSFVSFVAIEPYQGE